MTPWACRFFDRAPNWDEVIGHALVDAVSGAAPQQATEVKIAWTAEAFCVRFAVEDFDAWATLTERDAPLYTEEVVEVFLDPVKDLESYFEIEVNPLNAVLDLVLRKTRSGYRKDARWDCDGLRTSVIREPGAWIAELAIPFRSLGPEAPAAGSKWRANFTRIDRPKSAPRELSAWCAPGRPNFHTPERFGVIEFRR